MICLKSVELSNVKNVEYGKIDFPSSPTGSRIMGIYGQNGSGKTAVVDVLACLRDLLCGYSLRSRSADLVGVYSDRSSVEVEFEIGSAGASASSLLVVGRLFDSSVSETGDTERDAGADVVHDEHAETRVQSQFYFRCCRFSVFERFVGASHKAVRSAGKGQFGFIEETKSLVAVDTYVGSVEYRGRERFAQVSHVAQMELHVGVDVDVEVVQIGAQVAISQFYTYTFVVFEEVSQKRVQGSDIPFETEIFEEDKQVVVFAVEFAVREGETHDPLFLGDEQVVPQSAFVFFAVEPSLPDDGIGGRKVRFDLFGNLFGGNNCGHLFHCR